MGPCPEPDPTSDLPETGLHSSLPRPNPGDDALTARAAFAGGLKTGKDPTRPTSPGVVCYHNFQSIADYGKLGHGEVVSMRVPSSEVSFEVVFV